MNLTASGSEKQCFVSFWCVQDFSLCQKHLPATCTSLLGVFCVVPPAAAASFRPPQHSMTSDILNSTPCGGGGAFRCWFIFAPPTGREGDLSHRLSPASVSPGPHFTFLREGQFDSSRVRTSLEQTVGLMASVDDLDCRRMTSLSRNE